MLEFYCFDAIFGLEIIRIRRLCRKKLYCMITGMSYARGSGARIKPRLKATAYILTKYYNAITTGAEQ